jgi:hypothetical protein
VAVRRLPRLAALFNRWRRAVDAEKLAEALPVALFATLGTLYAFAGPPPWLFELARANPLLAALLLAALLAAYPPAVAALARRGALSRRPGELLLIALTLLWGLAARALIDCLAAALAGGT